ncbi:hypothetical protein [Nonomuraea turcica]|uniref:hypothetical protein n=1 Tax=Nonomuraea sp. G32 TaxID=3067274 RepID=UPI00273B0DF8|nr:hypothetical protein [Nonomuraea sp. G32]MDP4511826.1 hypothetical protein [Nonomuraea sp. G32]
MFRWPRRTLFAQLRREHATLLHQVPDPFDLEQFCGVLGRLAARHVVAHPFQLGQFSRLDACGVGGLYIRTNDLDIIGYAGYVPAPHQLMMIFHEAAHLVLGHYKEPEARENIAARTLYPSADQASSDADLLVLTRSMAELDEDAGRQIVDFAAAIRQAHGLPPTPGGRSAIQAVLGRTLCDRGRLESEADALATALGDRVRRGGLKSLNPEQGGALRELAGPLLNPYRDE